MNKDEYDGKKTSPCQKCTIRIFDQILFFQIFSNFTSMCLRKLCKDFTVYLREVTVLVDTTECQ